MNPHCFSTLHWSRWLPLAVGGWLVALSGCAVQAPAAAPAPSEALVQVFKSRGARQCEERGTAPEAMRAELERAGVRVHAVACGSDGRLRPAVCGAGTDEINLFDIAAPDLPRVQALGFVPLSSLRADPASPPTERPCR
ncbi:MAG: hypothetical protein Q4G70_09075 [Pseudomonadota bacterium]|nr:hypothetical protein [Pseudomonadota bacterium]